MNRLRVGQATHALVHTQEFESTANFIAVLVAVITVIAVLQGHLLFGIVGGVICLLNAYVRWEEEQHEYLND